MRKDNKYTEYNKTPKERLHNMIQLPPYYFSLRGTNKLTLLSLLCLLQHVSLISLESLRVSHAECNQKHPMNVLIYCYNCCQALKRFPIKIRIFIYTLVQSSYVCPTIYKAQLIATVPPPPNKYMRILNSQSQA